MKCAPLTGPRVHIRACQPTHKSPVVTNAKTISAEDSEALPSAGAAADTVSSSYRGQRMLLSFCSLAMVILGETFCFCSPGRNEREKKNENVGF